MTIKPLSSRLSCLFNMSAGDFRYQWDLLAPFVPESERKADVVSGLEWLEQQNLRGRAAAHRSLMEHLRYLIAWLEGWEASQATRAEPAAVPGYAACIEACKASYAFLSEFIQEGERCPDDVLVGVLEGMLRDALTTAGVPDDPRAFRALVPRIEG